MPIAVIIMCIVYSSAVSFLIGYLRGLNDQKTIENWGIGFDQGWEAAMKLVEEKKESGDAAAEDDEESLDAKAIENDRYSQEQDWLENHGRKLE